MTNHIAATRLALYACGDLSFWSRWTVARHVRTCEPCAALVADFVAVGEHLSEAATNLPPNLTGAAWDSLASEMTANIRLGISAGECVATPPVRVAPPRLAYALAGLAVLITLAGVSRPRADTSLSRMLPAGQEGAGLCTLEANASGIAVHGSGNMLSVSAPPGLAVIQTVNTRGDLHSRYTDDTGVTINAVYANAE